MEWSLKFAQLGAISGIVYAIVASRSYYEIVDGISSAVVNIEGTGIADLSDYDTDFMVFDPYDLRIPESEKNAAFVTTRVIEYKEQERGSDGDKEMICLATESDCALCSKQDIALDQGISTGECKNDNCVIKGWCHPEENTKQGGYMYTKETKYDARIQGIPHVNLTYQVTMTFPKYNATFKVTLDKMILGYNYWRIGDILEGLGGVPYEDVRDTGAVITVNMDWHCVFEKYDKNLKESKKANASQSIDAASDAVNAACKIEWNIFREDSDISEQTGFHFTKSSYQPQETIQAAVDVIILESRLLQKVYGLKILFIVSGRMQKFSYMAIVVNIGSLIGLMSLVPVVMDFVLRRRHANLSKMKDTDIDERSILHAKMIKRLLLEYLKGKEKKIDEF